MTYTTWLSAMTSPRTSRWVSVAVTAYAMGVALATVLLFGLADAHWLGSVAAFAPRWPLVVPALLLAPLAWQSGARGWAKVALVCGLWVAGPYMGLRVPWRRWVPSAGTEMTHVVERLRVATFNVAGRDLDDPWLHRAVASLDADVVGITECRTPHEHGLIGVQDDLAVASAYGFCLFSRHPIVAIDQRPLRDVWERGGSGVIVLFEIDVRGHLIDVMGIHLETVRSGLVGLRHGDLSALRDNIALRRWESELAESWSQRAKHPLIVMGDFNLPVESSIYRESWSQLGNAFGRCGTGYGPTKHTRWFGIRIDHILFDGSWECVEASTAHGGPSDHDPLVTVLGLKAALAVGP